MTDTPFPLPARAPAIRIRDRTVAAIRATEGERTQDLRGFEPEWRDIVHYIVGITEEIWTDRAVDRIRATYADDCVVHTSMGTTRGVEGVVAGTLQSLWAFTDYRTQHLNVAWSGDADDYYTSHLGFATSTHSGATGWGPATGARIGRYFAADCVSRNNRIHTEWLARDTGGALAHMGLDPLAVARTLAEVPAAEPWQPLPPDAPQPTAADPSTAEGWSHALFGWWNTRAFASLSALYAPDAVAHWPGLREAAGPRDIAHLAMGLLASLPDAIVRVEHVCWSEESDGPIVAVRWRIDGTSSPFGLLGALPAGRPVSLIVISHYRLGGGRIVEEWTVFDELAAFVQAIRT